MRPSLGSSPAAAQAMPIPLRLAEPGAALPAVGEPVAADLPLRGPDGLVRVAAAWRGRSWTAPVPGPDGTTELLLVDAAGIRRR